MNTFGNAGWNVLIATMFAVLTAAFPAAVQAGNWYVTNTGTDSSTCLDRDHACRSINQAIERATTGDVIWVGAGHYEAVSITKGVQIYSYQGTTATFIEAGPDDPAAVNILSDRVTFGAKNNGFTVTGGGSGVQFAYDSMFSTVTFGITVAGNVALDEPVGFLVEGRKNRSYFVALNACLAAGLPLQRCDSTGQVSLRQNMAVGGGAGFVANQNFDTRSPILLKDNRALGTGVGFIAGPGFTQTNGVEVGFRADLIQLVHNLATHNGVGFRAMLLGVVQGNIASANSQAGFVVIPLGTITTFKGNVATGNQGPGAIVFFQQGNGPESPIPNFAAFTQNDFYGNDRNRPSTTLTGGDIGLPAILNQLELPIGPAAHCGVLNVGAVAEVVGFIPTPPVQLSAPGNYWGSYNGPATTDPADAAGGVCDQNGGVTNVKPFSNLWFSFAPLAD